MLTMWSLRSLVLGRHALAAEQLPTACARAASSTSTDKNDDALFRDLLSDLERRADGGDGAASGSKEPELLEEIVDGKVPTKRHRRKMNLGKNEVSARLFNIKGSVKKVRLACDFVKGLNYQEAVAQLNLSPRRASADILRLIQTARSHAEHNFGLTPNRLLVHRFMVGRGDRTQKAVEFRARGRANIRLRRRSNVTVVLREVPYVEGEKRLGKWGRVNPDWKKNKDERAKVAKEAKHAASAAPLDFFDVDEISNSRVIEADAR